jgi:hypothetical protein
MLDVQLKLTWRATWNSETNGEIDQKLKKESEEYEIHLRYTLECSSAPEAERRRVDSKVKLEEVWWSWAPAWRPMLKHGLPALHQC